MLGRTLLGDETAVTACLLYLSVPSVNLITLHLDQVLLPLLATLPVVLIVASCVRRSIALAVLGGLALYLAAYFSFGLASMAVIVMAVFMVMLLKAPSRNWQSTLRLSGAALAAMAAFDASMRFFLSYDIVTRYTDASVFHAEWRGWEGGSDTLLRAGLTSTVEFFVWLGLPMTVLLMGGAGCFVHRALKTRRASLLSGLSSALAGVFLLLLLYGRTKAETGRLWMYLIPVICVVVARFMHSNVHFRRDRRVALTLFVLALQLGTVYLTLRHQNFF